MGNGTISNQKLDELISTIKSNYKQVNVSLIREAFFFAKNAHKNQFRLSKKPYFSHPLEVALILANFGADDITIAATLLHDVLEDTKIEKGGLRKKFGEEILSLVEGVSKLGKLADKTREEKTLANLQNLLLATTRDVRVIVIKLADRLHNIRTLEYLPEEDRKRIAYDSLTVYAPIAYKLGISEVGEELEDLCFQFLKPEIYLDLRRSVKRKRKTKLNEIDAMVKVLNKKFKGKNVSFVEKNKNLYSTYLKTRQGKSVDEIYDFIVLKLITESPKDCYAALGIIHHCFPPLPNKIEDYIALPKPNLYKAIHTTVIGPEGIPAQICILTKDMDEVARKGVIVYLQHGSEGIERALKKNLSKLNRIMHQPHTFKEDWTFMDALKIDFLNKTIFVFTPRGDKIELPVGATPIDFAYAANPDTANRSWKAKVNGKFSPLGRKLKSGDIVEIIPSKKVRVGKSWLNLVKSYEAKSAIKEFLQRKKAKKIRNGKASIDLVVNSTDRIGLLTEISEAISSTGININAASIGSNMYNKVTQQFNINLSDFDRLKKAMKKIKGIKGVKKVETVYNQ